MYFDDLSPCTYFGLSGAGKLKAMGWLVWGHVFPERQTELSEPRFYQLLRLLEDPWEPFHSMGTHQGEFCFDTEMTVNFLWSAVE